MEISKVFAEAVRTAPFGGHLTEGQVAGMNTILNAWALPQFAGMNDLRWQAYVLATAYWETAHTMQPVIETFNPEYDTENPSVDTAIARLENSWKAGHLPWVHQAYWRKDANGVSWLGRGLAQVTFKENYLKAEQRTGIAFTSDPSLMLQPEHAALVMLDGMISGWFTGVKLADHFPATIMGDPISARRIINGTDHAVQIADIYEQFFKALKLG